MADEMLGILLPQEAKQKLKEEAVQKGIKVSTHARMILLEHLQSNNKEKPARKRRTAR